MHSPVMEFVYKFWKSGEIVLVDCPVSSVIHVVDVTILNILPFRRDFFFYDIEVNGATHSQTYFAESINIFCIS